jgi:nucleotide-binding universal stress UspA family protein
MNGCIIVPVDGSDVSLHALDAAIDLAKVVDASIHAVHVIELSKAARMSYGDPQYTGACLDALRAEGESILETASKRIGEKTISVSAELLDGDPAEIIVRCAKQRGASWIVMGTHGRTGLSHLLLGSVAEGVLRHSDVPVLIVPMKHKARHSNVA